MVLKIVCLGRPSTVILLISASRVARIAGMSHQPLTVYSYFGSNSSPTKKKKKRAILVNYLTGLSDD
jgi:hypothetical protein